MTALDYTMNEPGHEGDWCRAVSQHGTPVTAYIAGMAILAIARPGRDFICTQDDGHQGSHAACDGRGSILAKWPRRAVEQYWQPASAPEVTPLCGPT